MEINLQTISIPPQNLQDEDIISCIKTGDINAYGSIVRRYNQRLFRIARSIVIDDSTAMDIVQEAHIKAYTKLDQFQGQTSFIAWLSRITRNEALMYLRKYKKEISLPDEELHFFAQPDSNNSSHNTGCPGTLLEGQQLKNAINRIIDKLPEDFRIVFVLRAIEQLSVNETAEILDLKEATVKTRYFRAKRLLQEQIRQHLAEASEEVYAFGAHHCDKILFNVMVFIKNSRES